jgi:dGTPase
MPELTRTVSEGFAERIREQEDTWLSPLAVRSYETRGRAEPEAESDLRTPFQHDRDRIVHSKAFRRLKHKTQVFISPEGDHVRTRLTHTLETTGIARGVARALQLNEDLVEAVGLGHDLGHAPFGHAGEEALDALVREHYGVRFRHNEHSLRVVDVLERDGRGMNLTWEVRDGILNHTGENAPATLEGRIVRIVDRVAYINHDIDDAVRGGLLAPDDLPAAEIALLGDTGSRRIDTLVHDLVETSAAAGDIRQSEQIGGAMLALRRFMFDRVYLGEASQAEHRRAAETVVRIFEHLRTHPEALPAAPGELPQRITDYVAGMTDRYALAYAAAL